MKCRGTLIVPKAQTNITDRSFYRAGEFGRILHSTRINSASRNFKPTSNNHPGWLNYSIATQAR